MVYQVDGLSGGDRDSDSSKAYLHGAIACSARHRSMGPGRCFPLLLCDSRPAPASLSKQSGARPIRVATTLLRASFGIIPLDSNQVTGSFMGGYGLRGESNLGRESQPQFGDDFPAMSMHNFLQAFRLVASDSLFEGV